MENKRFFTATDVQEMLGVSLSYAYKLIRRLNAEQETKGLVTVEDHFAGCGMGAMIAAALAETTPARVIKVGVQDKFGQSGSPMDLFEAYGMTAPHIKEKAMLLMAE